MSGTLTASQVKPGVRRSKKYTTGRVCAFETCETVISAVSYTHLRAHET